VIVTLQQRARAVCRRLMNACELNSRLHHPFPPLASRRGWRKRWLRAASERRIANGKVIIAAINHLPNPILPFIPVCAHQSRMQIVSLCTCGLPNNRDGNVHKLRPSCMRAPLYMQSSVCCVLNFSTNLFN